MLRYNVGASTRHRAKIHGTTCFPFFLKRKKGKDNKSRRKTHCCATGNNVSLGSTRHFLASPLQCPLPPLLEGVNYLKVVRFVLGNCLLLQLTVLESSKLAFPLVRKLPLDALPVDKHKHREHNAEHNFGHLKTLNDIESNAH
uniref:Uncharacterized protein n=1 Tax=Trypanosoma congolense (strain IL3000) TaxID=1068625 RepID=F9WAT7_TRYCI|nr:hypothetical protein, unlikely [Trypanosoma congolense IL3000]